MESSTVKLSLCIPTYNRVDTLEILLESVYRQIGSHKDEVEVCISDNASTDSTGAIIKKYVGKLNIQYNKFEYTVHTVLNWDYAIDKMPAGKYVLMIGDDDILINNAIERMLELIDTYEADYYYLNHIHAQINVNRDKVYNNNCRMEYDATECECYEQNSSYVEKWESILNYPGKYQEINMLFIGNHLMKKGIWKIDLEHFEKMYSENGDKPLCEETMDYYYTVWSPQVTVVAKAMMGKTCYYCGEPMICQGMGMNVSDEFQVFLLLFMPRWLELFRGLGMDGEEYKKYLENVTRQEINRYVNLLLYKPDVVKAHPYCANFIKYQENTNMILAQIAEKLTDKKNDFYFNMADNQFKKELSGIIKNRNGRVVLWGTGDVGKNYIHALPELKENIDFVVDGNITLHGKIYEELGLVIQDPQEIKKETVYMVITASIKYEKEIENTLKEWGIREFYMIGSQGIAYMEGK